MENYRYGYARVSTSGQELESQIRALENERCDEIFSEKFTGTKMDRPQFNELLKVLKPGDTLIVTKLDRFARSASDGMNTIKELFKRGIRVHVLNMGMIEDTPTGRLIFNIMSSFAEFERDMIVERTQEGKAIAKLNPDFKEGRPKKFKQKHLDNAMQLLETNSLKQVSEITGISTATLSRNKAKRKELQ